MRWGIWSGNVRYSCWHHIVVGITILFYFPITGVITIVLARVHILTLIAESIREAGATLWRRLLFRSRIKHTTKKATWPEFLVVYAGYVEQARMLTFALMNMLCGVIHHTAWSHGKSTSKQKSPPADPNTL